MTRLRFARKAVVSATLLALLAGCGINAEERPVESKAAPTEPESEVTEEASATTLTTGQTVESKEPVGGAPTYNYAPTALLDRGVYGLWWCGSAGDPLGDDAAHGVSKDPNGPFLGKGAATAVAALSGTGRDGDFDSMHVCDPNVMRVDDTYYMYYTGSLGGQADWGRNQIGLATSVDGETWERANKGRSVLTQSGVIDRGDSSYGTGQPAAAYKDGWYYVLLTDKSAAGSSASVGGGQFLQRSKDPAFTRGVEILTEKGFEPTSTPSSPRTYSLIQAFSVDFAWFEALDAWGIAHQVPDGTQVTFFSEDFASRPYEPLIIPGAWKEGPGFLRTFEGRIPVSTSDPCGTVPVTVYRSSENTETNHPTALRRFATEIENVDGCGSTEEALELLEGTAIPVQGNSTAYDLVSDGRLIRVADGEIAQRSAVQVLETRPQVLSGVSPEATVPLSAELVTNGEETGLLDGKTLYRIRGAATFVAPPDVHVRAVGQAEWQSYAPGATLG
ncbi:hypothetical protein [Brevibacterium samyangense]|uniref:Beta-xylosidase n=1 Tax=Brevibacterium samyangense TaxID=366888 RepID=A0ABP5F591_9MICO